MTNIAFVFAGQGAQVAGMGKSLYGASPAAQKLLDQFDSIRPGTLKQCFEPEGDEQNITINTQPCLFAIDCACAIAAEEKGIMPRAAAGFSLGEVAAAAFTGVMSYPQAFRFVIKRAEAMQRCAEQNPGGMYAVLKLSADEVEALCAELPGVYPVNYNAPGQIVVACAQDQLERFEQRVADAGAKAMRLKVSGGFHSPFMNEASQALLGILKEEPLAAPRMPLYANKTGDVYPADIAETLAAQVSSPVRWQKTIETMRAAGIDTFIEVGAGKTLTGLIRRIDKSAKAFNIEDMDSLAAAVAALEGGAEA